MAETKKIACFYFIDCPENGSFADVLKQYIENNDSLINMTLLSKTIEVANRVGDVKTSVYEEDPKVQFRNICTLAMQLVHRHAYKSQDAFYITTTNQLIRQRMKEMVPATEDYMQLEKMVDNMTAERQSETQKALRVLYN